MMIAFNSIPKVAIVPLLVIWFGIGTIPAIMTAFLISFFPIVVNVATGLATIEPELLDVLRSLGARKHQIVMRIGIPRSMPYFFASLKVAISLAFIGSVVSESIASNVGIGYLMLAASARFDVPLVFAGFAVISIMGVIMYEITAYAERHFTFWATRANDIVT
jgi:NitT/TauT family transport system permease protein